jgi:Dolichyl-phosphate-mannose-protein mannosyltransferase
MRSPARSRTLLLVVLAGGALLRVWGLRFGFPHPVARPDEEVLVDAALAALRDGNPNFFDWPSAFIYTTAGSYAALFAVERLVGGAIRHATIAKAAYQPVLHLIPRALSAAAGVLTIAALYGAAREIFSRRIALLAAAFLAVAFLHVRDSHFGVTDVPATLLTVCAFWAALRCATRGATDARVALAGALCGLGASTKYNAALVLLPAIAAIVRPVDGRSAVPLPSAARSIALLAVCAAGAFLVGTPFAVLDHRMFLASIAAVRSHLAGGHVIMTRGWPYHAAFTLRYGLGIPLVAAACAGAVWLTLERPRLALLVLVFPIPYYVYLGSGQTVFVRYLVPMVPFVCLAAAYFVDRAGAFAAARLDGLAGDVLVVALAAIVCAPTLRASVLFDRLMAAEDTRVAGANWIAARFPRGVSMYQTGFGAGHLQPTPLAFYPQYTFNERAGRFEVDHHPADAPPDVIVLLESPLGPYSIVPPRIAGLVTDGYALATSIDSVPPDQAAEALYDREDAFFAPFAGIEHAVRPGPNVRIFVRHPAFSGSPSR